MFRAGAGLLALASVLSLPVFAAGRCGPATVQLTVLDQGGTSLVGLVPSDFRVRIRNNNANVTAVDYGVFPHTTLVLISRTASMGQSVKIQMAREMADAIVASAPGTVLGGNYGSQVSGLLNARDGQVFGASLQAGTEPQNVIYDAIVTGLTGAQLHRGDAVVVITDSADNGSKSSASDVQQRLSATGVRLFVVALPPAGNGAASVQALTEVAEYSGGAMIVPLKLEQTTAGVVIPPAQLEAAVTTMNRIYTQYGNIYQIETDQEGQDKPMPLRIEVERHKVGGGKVVAPAMLAPCTSLP
jgi:hypothetical protein